jgi:hypothetical protein
MPYKRRGSKHKKTIKLKAPNQKLPLTAQYPLFRELNTVISWFCNIQLNIQNIESIETALFSFQVFFADQFRLKSLSEFKLRYFNASTSSQAFQSFMGKIAAFLSFSHRYKQLQQPPLCTFIGYHDAVKYFAITKYFIFHCFQCRELDSSDLYFYPLDCIEILNTFGFNQPSNAVAQFHYLLKTDHTQTLTKRKWPTYPQTFSVPAPEKHEAEQFN